MRIVTIWMGLGLTLLASHAHADDASAEALFREGKQLMAEGKYELACPKLRASYDADPATGALLAVAICFEKAGKTASSWAAYTEVAARARRERQTERESTARKRAQELESKLSRLTVEVGAKAARVPGLRVLRDGELVPSGGWNSAVPIDPGEHVVEATATDHKSWKQTLSVKPNGDRVAITVPELETEASVPPPKLDARPHEKRSPREPGVAVSEEGRSSLRTWAYVAGGVGLVSVGVGSYFGLRAISKNGESEDDCSGNVCGEAGSRSRNDARSAGTVSTFAFVAGGALLATGVTLFLIGKPNQERPAARVRVGAAHLLVEGKF